MALWSGLDFDTPASYCTSADKGGGCTACGAQKMSAPFAGLKGWQAALAIVCLPVARVSRPSRLLQICTCCICTCMHAQLQVSSTGHARRDRLPAKCVMYPIIPTVMYLHVLCCLLWTYACLLCVQVPSGDGSCWV